MIPENYKMKYTWFQDFRIADAFGIKAIKDTYNRAFNEWNDNWEAMAELTFCLNIKCWDFYHEGKLELSAVYANLYHDCYDKCIEHFKDDELTNYWRFLD